MRKKCIIKIFIREDGKIIYDLGKKNQSIFILIGILGDVINDLSRIGFKQEEDLKGGIK